jgi:RNA polymerase sigma factor (sigma-70 family)
MHSLTGLLPLVNPNPLFAYQKAALGGGSPMTTLITSYTTYDQAYYYADLNRIPRLTEQARQDLLTRLPTTRSQDGMTEAQQQLIESYLPLANRIAIDLCPRFVHRCLPDLIGAASLALVELIVSHDLSHIEGSPTPYFAACLRGAIKKALSQESMIKMDWDARAWAKAQGIFDQLQRVVSLDACMRLDESDRLEEPYAIPITPSTPAPERDESLRAKVEQYLSYLPERTQTILRLRYGLGEEDERDYSVIEIAAYLGLTRETVNSAIHDGMARLRALVEGKATISRHKGKARISYPAIMYNRRITETKEAALLCAYAELEASGTAVTGDKLAKAAGVGITLARVFLRSYRPETPKERRAEHRQARLKEAYERLTTQAQPFTYATLAREARVGKPAAKSFLEELRNKSVVVA